MGCLSRQDNLRLIATFKSFGKPREAGIGGYASRSLYWREVGIVPSLKGTTHFSPSRWVAASGSCSPTNSEKCRSINSPLVELREVLEGANDCLAPSLSSFNRKRAMPRTGRCVYRQTAIGSGGIVGHRVIDLATRWILISSATLDLVEEGLGGGFVSEAFSRC